MNPHVETLIAAARELGHRDGEKAGYVLGWKVGFINGGIVAVIGGGLGLLALRALGWL